MSKQIELSNNLAATVSDEDYPMLTRFRWYAQRVVRNGEHVGWYAVTSYKSPKGWRMISMHRMIMHALEGEIIDHRKGDGLLNVRENLRLADSCKNLYNAKRPRNNSTGQRGVTLNKKTGTFYVYINADKKRHHIGSFAKLEDAIAARKAAADKYHGEFAGE